MKVEPDKPPTVKRWLIFIAMLASVGGCIMTGRYMAAFYAALMTLAYISYISADNDRQWWKSHTVGLVDQIRELKHNKEVIGDDNGKH